MGAFLIPGFGIRDPGWEKVIELGNLFCDLFKVKIPKFFDEDLRSGLETVRIRGPG